MVKPMLRPDVFGGLATHAGDALFETCYLLGFPRSVRTLRETTTGRTTGSGRSFGSPGARQESGAHALNDWCMAACYSADEDGPCICRTTRRRGG